MVEEACELYARLKIGQFNRITESLLDVRDVKEYCERRNIANDLLRTVACVIFGCNQYGLPDCKQDKLHHRAWNIYAMLRYRRSWHDQPEGNLWSVAFDEPMTIDGEAPPECEVVDE